MKFKLNFIAIIFLSASSILYGSELDSNKVHKIDEVVVKSYKFNMKLKNAPNKVEIITAKDIEKSGSMSIMDIIKFNISCEAANVNGLSSAIEFRGFTPSAMISNKYSLILIDGIPVGTKSGATMMPGNISSIEIFKGPFSAIYGSGAMGGFINTISADSKGKIGGKAMVGYGSYQTVMGSFSMGGNITEKLDFDLSLSTYRQGENYKTGKGNALKMTDNETAVIEPLAADRYYDLTYIDKNNITARLGYDLGKDWKLNLYNDVFFSADAPSLNTIWSMDGTTTQKDLLRHHHHLDVMTKKGKHSIRLTPYFSRETSNDYYNTKYIPIETDNTYSTYGFQLQDIIEFSVGQLIVGMDNLSQRYSSRCYSKDGDRIAPNQPDYLNSQTGFLAQTNLTFFKEKLSVVAGVRYDITKLKSFKSELSNSGKYDKTHHNLNPNVAAKYNISKVINVHASAGRAYLSPDAFMSLGEYRTTFGLYRGNSDLKSESSFSYDAGICVTTPNRAFIADATLFSTNFKNKIISKFEGQVENPYTTFINAEKAKTRGIEFMFALDIARLMQQKYSLSIFANATHIFKSDLITEVATTPIRYLSKNTATAGIDLSIKRFSARLSARYIGSKINDNYIMDFDSNWNTIPVKTPEGDNIRGSLINDPLVTLPNFLIFNLNLSYNISRNLSASIFVNNLFNELYAERDGYYMPGINGMASVSIKW